ncbi:MAG: radical SAM protein [Candidatus Omnitrophica bacterium]|nr:radical SAM protein [Candidatus Omnitrophota bacterium]
MIISKKNKKDVLLIYPGQFAESDPNFPIQLLCLAKPLIEQGISVDILDLRINDYRYFDFREYRVIGITVMTVFYNRAKKITEFIRKTSRDSIIVYGGHHPSLEPITTLKENEAVNYLICGEGEASFLKLCQKIIYKSDIDFLDIEGLVFKLGNDVFVNKPKEILNLDDTSFLPYGLLALTDYPKAKERFEFYSSRGCPHSCSFCSNSIRNIRWRAKTPAVMIEEIKDIIFSFSPKIISIFDANFFVSKSRIAEFCKLLIKEKIKVKFYAMGRCDYFAGYDADFMKLLTEAGFIEIAMGAESGSLPMLKYLNKNITVEMIISSVKNCVAYKIKPILSFVIDVPNETKKDIYQTLDLYDAIVKLGAAVNGIFLFIPFPGSKITSEIIEKFQLSKDTYARSLYDIKEVGYHSRSYELFCQTIAFCAHLFLVRSIRKNWSFSRKLARDKHWMKVVVNDSIDWLFYYLAKARWRLRFFYLGYDLRIYWWLRNRDFSVKDN